MIPNVFVSSTIADLQYLRETLRDALTEVAYNPVMSEHGGVGYIHEGSAADACYVTMQQCHIAILIIGKRYGSIGSEGLSVTHREFHTARRHEIPLITFVDADVMSFKKVFDADPESATWNHFEYMDHARETFKLVDEVITSQIYNGLIEFRTATEAKSRLKQQLAHFMGDRLTGAIRPIKTDVHEILAEVKALRNQMSHESSSSSGEIVKAVDPFYIALRFLLEERNRDYTRFVEAICGDLDIAAHKIQSAETIEDLIEKAGGTFEVVEDDFGSKPFWREERNRHRIRIGSEGIGGFWGMTSNKHVYLSESMRVHLNDKQASLALKLK
ncbi:DUF4062 domain-containing protein [Luteolibacter pohnpeiensis]|uniref:DUF4062 domain-containing protein n=1 Tax=Luteolibacter pohnpeiensis TaxID=454153 RepID=A0A934SG78_9BACT|nr:DUF4062 domain-containing protein [Luteolibacter pohnpeiensis]MBK1884613.1 DUF4062 domain-containing protein [Luteolibacter pohnpeiensis]